MYKNTVLFLAFLLVSLSSQAQEKPVELFRYFLQKNQPEFSADDVQNLKIVNKHQSKKEERNYVYVQQFLEDIPILNATGSVVIMDDKVVASQGNFINKIKSKKNTSQPQLSPNIALQKATENLQLEYTGRVELISAKSEQQNQQYFKAPLISDNDIPIELTYVSMDEELRLSWKLVIKKNNHWWSIAVDATSGEILWKNDWVNECNFDPVYPTTHTNSILEKNTKKNQTGFSTNASYKVYAMPIASPDHGNRTVVNSPENFNASPFGWHDDDGVDGEEYTDTRGNNVWAFENRDGDNTVGEFAQGGSNLVFDQALNLNQDPLAYVDAATVNLFYWNNIMHDVWYEYGFDEASGNFQSINYGNTNQFGPDHVLARAQDGANGGPGNNATFGTPPDGESGVMRMFTWGSDNPPFLLTINSPPSLAGNYQGLQAVFAANIPSNGIQADLILIEESNSFTSDPYDACETISNGADLNGNIAVIRRGTCSFLDKVQKAQNAGAVGVIIVNNVSSDLIYMQSNSSPSISIPAIMISQNDGTALINNLETGQSNGTLANIGPFEKDGDFDAGIIAHEYGHGISNRLTGGAANSDCLIGCVDYDQNGNCIQATEQMGEGWSDYFALVMTQQAGDQAEDAKGIATYVTNQPTNGTGIRNAPYSTDFAVNDFTYGDTNNTSQLSAPHGVGFVWATMLWDLHWAFIGEYGYDADIYQGTGGNNKVMSLVIEGLKLQSCNPGFIDGRDAILQADVLQNNGDNQCLIWSVFANRGLGFGADQGSSLSRTDQTEAFDMPPNSVLDCRLGTSAVQEKLWRVYPNPTKGVVTIGAKNVVNNAAEISIFDINGRKVLSTKITANQPVDVSSLTTGVYILKINSAEKTQTEKLIVE